MITEDYVSFETAKLLKEKRFDESTIMRYDSNGEISSDGRYGHYNSLKKFDFISAPTLQMAMKWLRKVHNIHIMVDCIGSKNYMPIIQFICDSRDIKVESDGNKIGGNGFDSSEEACEAAIKYCIESFI